MKIANLFVFFVAIMGLSACSHDDVTYSCDKKVDSWVKENIHEIRQMTRSNWLNTQPAVNVAIYRAFSPSQKYQFWMDKFDEIKSLPWNDLELAHIESAEDFVRNHKEFFREGDLTENELDEIETFFYKWEKDAIENLGWSKKIVGSLMATGLKVKNIEGEVIVPNKPDNGMITYGFAEPDCNCNQNNDFCEVFHCEPAYCTPSEHGCGWIWWQSCNGRCGGI